MNKKICYSYVFIILLCNIIASLNICPKGKDLYFISDPKASIREKSIYYTFGDTIKTTEVYINLEIKPKEQSYASLIISKDIPQNASKKNLLELNFISKKDKNRIFLQIQKNINETHSENEDEMIPIESNDIPITMKFDIFIEKKEMTIIYKQNIAYSKIISVENLLDNYTYIYYLESSKDKNQKVIQDFTVCYLKSEPNLLRNIEENEKSKLAYIEVDNYSILQSPNILREGSIRIIPSVILNPKNENGSFPSDILNYSRRNLRSLFNLTHSKNISFYYNVVIVVKKLLAINIKTQMPGEIYITSTYFKNNEKYIIKINNSPLDISKTYVYLDEKIISGENSKIKIIPKDDYGNHMSFLDESEIEKFQLNITLSNKAVIKAEQAIFDLEEKAIIFNVLINYIGEAFIKAKYEDINITCENCDIYIDGDWEPIINVNYSEKIMLGEISNLTISPKEEYITKISAENIFNILGIKCYFDDIEHDVISKLNKDNNTIVISQKELITSTGNITWQLLFDNKTELNYTVSIISEAIIKNLKFTINSDNLTEISENNTKITLDVKSDFIIIYELLDLYYNKLPEIDSANITEVQLFGNNMIPILFNIQRNENIFNISIPENNKEDFHYLVSGSNYELTIKVEKNNITTLFYFNINLTSSENDTDYGNGPYNISHCKIEPNLDLYEMTVGEKYIFYLYLRTQKDLLCHRELDINEHLKLNQSFEDSNFIFKASKINSTLGIFLIELYTNKSNDNTIELDLTLDDEKLKNITVLVQPLPYPNFNNTEISDYTKHIYNDIEPINIYIILKDDYFNIINQKDIAYKKQLVAMIGNENIDQNIHLNTENKTYIISFVTDYHVSSINISLFYNNSNDLILIKSGLIVQSHVTKFLEPEPIITTISYKTGIAFLYENLKLLNISIKIEDEINDKKQDIEARGDFILYIRDKNYELSNNGTKVVLYTGYLAILELKYKNLTTNEEINYLYDKKLINVYNQIKNNSDTKRIYNLNNTINESTGFIKIDFYETGDIKQMYYPKTESFVFKSMEYLRETAALIIPKISSNLFSDDIQNKFNEMQQDIKDNNSTEEKKNSILRRLSESGESRRPKKSKINQNKIKKKIFRILQEDTNEEEISEDEIIPTENDLDIQLREINNNGDNTSNLTLLSLGDVKSDTAKLTGSLDNKTVLTNINEEGKVCEIYQKQNTQLVSDVKDKALDDYIYNNTYTEDSVFERDLFEAENETEIRDEMPMKIKGLTTDNINSVRLLDDFLDDNGTLIEHFDSFEFEEFNDTVYDNYNLEEMGNDFLRDINGSNMSVEITDEFYTDSNNLRRLASSNYPYYGQNIINQLKDVYEKSFAGLTMRTYIETINYPHNGQVTVNTVCVFGSIKKTLKSQTTYSNNHIILKNKNTMTYDLVKFLEDQITNANTYKINSELQLYSAYPYELKRSKPYSYDTLYDDYYNGLLDKLNQQDMALNRVYPNMYQYIVNSKNNIVNMCLNNKNKIKDDLNKTFNENINKLNNYQNLGISLNTDILNLIKQKYNNGLANEDRVLLQEISDDLNCINNEIKKNISEYLSLYNSKISKKLDIKELEQESTLKAEYENKINNYISNFSNINFGQYISNKKLKKITEMLTEQIALNKKSISFLYSNIKEFGTKFNINKEKFSSINNSLSKYLEVQYNIEDEDKKINNLKEYLVPIYNNLHYFLINFYKELSQDVFYKLKDIKHNKYKSIAIKEQLFNLTEYILEEYNYPIYFDMDGSAVSEHLNKTDKYFNDYNQTIMNHLNDFEEIVSNYDISDELWNKFNTSLQELIDSFDVIGQNKDKILEYPEELDYIINTFESFRNDLVNIFGDINNYSKDILTKKILPLYININFNYVRVYHKLNYKYLIENVDQYALIRQRDTEDRINLYDEYFQSIPSYINNSIIPSIYEKYENFKIINESAINRFNSTIETGFNRINTIRNTIYNYFHDRNHNVENRTKYQNNLMRARLEMVMSYIDLFGRNLNETYDENDFSDILIDNTNLEELENISYFMEMKNDIENIIETYANNYTDLERNLNHQLDENIDKDTFLGYYYRTLDFENIHVYYDMILNFTDELFVNYTKNYFYNYNDSIYSLLSQYESVLYQYVKGYDYDIISFDIFENYFNNLTNTLANKFDLIKNKTQTIKNPLFDPVYDEEYYYINRFYYDNISLFIEERNENFSRALEINDFQTKIIDRDFSLSNFILDYSFNLYHMSPYIIDEKNTSIFIDEMSNLISELEYPIKNTFKNITDEFLLNFQKGVNISEKNRKNVINTYRNVFKFPNNNTLDRKCWNYRGIFFDDIVKEDQINYNKYLKYLDKKQLIEECKTNETLDCIYDSSELEEVEFINQTEIYINCYNEKKIYSHKHSIFESMEDFDLEQLNKIKNELFNILDECYSFENFITNYFYKRYGLNEMNNFTELNIHIEKLANKTKTFINKYVDKFNDYLSEKVGSKIKNLFNDLYKPSGLYRDQIKGNIDTSLNLLNNLKNRLFNKYYKNQYSEMQELFLDLIKNLAILTPSLNKTLINFFEDILKEQNQYSIANWTNNVDEKLSFYYSNQFPNSLADNFLNFIRENITKSINNSFFEENIDSIIIKAESQISSSTTLSDLINKILNGDYKNYGFDISMENSGENNNNEKIKENLEKLNVKQFSETELELINEVNTIKNNFLSSINLTYEEFDKENKIISYINNTIYGTYKVNNTFDIMVDELLLAPNITDYIMKVPNFMEIAYNMSIDYYKTIYSKIANYYKKIIQLSKEYPLFNDDLIDDKFGELGGYSLINGLDHLDPVCENNICPYKLDMKSLAEEEDGGNRRLSENDTSEEVIEIVNLLKKMKDIIHDMPYTQDMQDMQNTQDISDIKDNVTERIRKLTILNSRSILATFNAFNINKNTKKYDSTGPSMERKNVEAVLPNIKDIIASYNEYIYKKAKIFANDIKKKFTDELNNFENIYEDYLDNLKDKLQRNDYINFNSNLTLYYKMIDRYVSNMTNSIFKLSETCLNIIENIYVKNQIAGSMTTNKVLHYYDMLENVISEKYKAIDEAEYKAHKSLLRRNEAKDFTQQMNSLSDSFQIVIKQEKKTSQKIAEREKTMVDLGIIDDEDIPDVMKYEDKYDWNDKDNIDEPVDEDDKDFNLMKKDPEKVAKKKKEQEEKEQEEEAKQSEFDKYCKDIEKAMEKLHLKAETEITFNWKEKKLDISTNLAWEYEKAFRSGYQFPFCLPAIPAFQFRIGLKSSLYFKITIGIQSVFEMDKDKFTINVNPYIDLSVGTKIEIVAEIGLFTGFLDAYGGISGTMLDAKAQVKEYFYLLKGYLEFYSAVNVYALRFRIYVEVVVKINLIFYSIKIKNVIYDKTFGADKPFYEAFYYIKVSFKGQLLDEAKDANKYIK